MACNTILTTENFDKWFDSLKDKIGKKRIHARIGWDTQSQDIKVALALMRQLKA
jgi:hypothetical protein